MSVLCILDLPLHPKLGTPILVSLLIKRDMVGDGMLPYHIKSFTFDGGTVANIVTIVCFVIVTLTAYIQKLEPLANKWQSTDRKRSRLLSLRTLNGLEYVTKLALPAAYQRLLIMPRLDWLGIASASARYESPPVTQTQTQLEAATIDWKLVNAMKPANQISHGGNSASANKPYSRRRHELQ